MDDLHKAHAELIEVWKFYKEYAPRTPKDDDFYADMVDASTRIRTATTFGHKVLVAAIDAISTDDWIEKNK